MKKLLLIAGGRSTEHEVSLRSAATIYRAFDRDAFEVCLLFVSKRGISYLIKDPDDFFSTSSETAERVEAHLVNLKGSPVLIDNAGVKLCSIDVAFPIIHGATGEDGAFQGLAEWIGLPYVGPGVFSSACAMDKEFAKILLSAAGLDVAEGFVAHAFSGADLSYADAVKELGDVLFVKPAGLGSSVGVSKATDEASFRRAMREAFKYDVKALVEEAIEGREIEVAVLGNLDKVEASLPGEVVTPGKVYTYEEKYISTEPRTVIPVPLSGDITEKLQKTAILAYRALGCEGLARVDCFLRDGGDIVINELNTLPGFTSISMYPQLWEASGTPLKALLTKLVALALERHARDVRLETDYR